MHLSSSELLDAVRGRQTELRPETLAYLARSPHAQSHEGVELLEVVAGQLLRLMRPVARSIGHGAIRTDEDWEDGTQYAFYAMQRDFASTPTDELTFWEVNFRRIFKMRYIDGVRHQRRKADRTAVHIEQVPEDGAAMHAPALRPLDQMVIREVLAILSPEEAVAARLRWFDDLPMSGEGSVPEVMGVSRKTAYKYLGRAKAKVQAHPRFDLWTELG